MKINLLDLFSGIGGFSQGLKQAGFEIDKHYHAEIDKHANAIYKHQFPGAKLLGDVRHVHGADLGQIDVITFGSPCQDFSLAGKRRGLDGERSSLITEAIRLIDERRPNVFIWENVKGAFSSNAGADFWAIIQAFAYLGGYRLEWQLLNTAWFLPQNRERIYLVGRVTERCRGDVFPLTQKTKGFNEGSKQTRSVRCLTAGGNSGGLHSSMTLLKTAFTLTSNKNTSGIAVNERIRRLTEIECERLQGFSDNWSQYGNYDGQIKPVSATQRYKCLGNAVTVNVVEAVAKAVLKTTELKAGMS